MACKCGKWIRLKEWIRPKGTADYFYQRACSLRGGRVSIKVTVSRRTDDRWLLLSDGFRDNAHADFATVKEASRAGNAWLRRECAAQEAIRR